MSETTLTAREAGALLEALDLAEEVRAAWLARVDAEQCLCVHPDAAACARSPHGCVDGDCACHGSAS